MAGKLTIRAGMAFRQIKACRYCTNPIKKGSQILVGTSWNDSMKWRRMSYWHMERISLGEVEHCFIEFQKAYLAAHPIAIRERRAGAGRPKLEITLEDRKKRRSILVRRSQLEKEKETLMSMGLSWAITKPDIDRINGKIRELRDKLELVGGVPNSGKWKT